MGKKFQNCLFYLKLSLDKCIKEKETKMRSKKLKSKKKREDLFSEQMSNYMLMLYNNQIPTIPLNLSVISY